MDHRARHWDRGTWMQRKDEGERMLDAQHVAWKSNSERKRKRDRTSTRDPVSRKQTNAFSHTIRFLF